MGNPPEGRSRLIAYGHSTTSIAASGTVACLAVEGGEILTVDLRTAETKVIARCEERGAAASMVVDGEHVYALRIGGIGCRLVRAPLGGGPEETLVDGLPREVAHQWLLHSTGGARAPAFALHEGHLFWFDGSKGDVMRVPASGGTPARVAHVRRDLESSARMSSRMCPVGAVVASDGYVLWTAYPCEELASEPAVTDEASRLDWEAHRRDVRLRATARLALFRAPTSGGEPEVVVRDFGLATTLAAGGGLVAWSAVVEDGARRTALRCMSVRGGEVTELFDSLDGIGHVAVWDGAIYAAVGPHGAEIWSVVPAGGGGATTGRAAPASVTTSDHGHLDAQPRSDGIPRTVVPARFGVYALAVGAFGVVWKTAWSLFVKAFHDAAGAVDLANRPDDPAASTPEITPSQRALEDDVDAEVRRWPIPEGDAVERVRVTFAAPFASYWRIRDPDGRGRTVLVVAAVEPSEAALEAFRRAVTLDYERIFFDDVIFVHLRGAAPLVRRVGGFEYLDAFRGVPHWSDVSERRRAHHEKSGNAGGARIATCHARRARVWDARTGEELRAILSPDGVEQVALSPDGWTLVTAGENALVRFWDVATGETVRSYRVSDAWLRGMALSPDWTKLAIAASGSLLVVDASTGAELHRFRGNHPRAFDTLSRVAWRPDGAALVATMGSSGAEVSAFVWDLGSPTMRWAVRDRPPRRSTFDHRGRAAQAQGGNPEGVLGYSIGLTRFDIGELDPYLPEPLVVPGDTPLPPPIRLPREYLS